MLFVCVHNAGRSQMAAGYLTHLAGDRIDVRSAGSEPADQINPVAVAAMAEEGIDITAEQPKILTTDAVQSLRRRHHHGLRRHLPLLSRQTLRGLGPRRPRRPRPSTPSDPSATRSDAASKSSSPNSVLPTHESLSHRGRRLATLAPG